MRYTEGRSDYRGIWVGDSKQHAGRFAISLRDYGKRNSARYSEVLVEVGQALEPL